jgi:hypothetical protein
MSFKAKIAAGAATFALVGGGVGLAGTTVASASKSPKTPTCSDCTHVQNVYAFRGNLDSLGQGTSYNNPVVLWYGTGTTSDPGQDFRWRLQGIVSRRGPYKAFHDLYGGDAVIRLQYTPYGNNSANVYLGLDGLKAAIRPDNMVDPEYQSWVVDLKHNRGHKEAVLINVGETTNPADPYVLTDPGYAAVGSKTQLDLEILNVNQYRHVDTSQLWRDGDVYEHPVG